MFTAAKLIRVENLHAVTKETDPDFFRLIQQGILMGLHSDGLLTMTQYRNAENALKEQRHSAIRNGTGGGVER